MARFLTEQDSEPDIILSSSANRARSTAEILRENLSTSVNLELVDDLYLAPPSVYLEYVSRLPEEFRRPMLVGHNPGLEDLVGRLSGEYHRMPTATIALFELAVETWDEAANDSSFHQLNSVWRPKEIELPD